MGCTFTAAYVWFTSTPKHAYHLQTQPEEPGPHPALALKEMEIPPLTQKRNLVDLPTTRAPNHRTAGTHHSPFFPIRSNRAQLPTVTPTKISPLPPQEARNLSPSFLRAPEANYSSTSKF